MINTDVVDLSTGQVMENVSVITERERDGLKTLREAKEKYLLKGAEISEKYKEYGEFVWLLYNVNQALDWGITPDTLTRLIYISTYMTYDNKLVLPSGRSIRHKDLQKLLGVSERCCRTFWESVTSAQIITESKEGCLYLNTALFHKGTMKKDISVYRMRLYINGIRSIYEESSPREHKFLSYLFQAIPFVNCNYNMLCFNAAETNLNNVKAMQMKDYCEIIGYSPENDRRLKSTMKKLRIDDLPVFSFVDNADGLFCYVNPNVFYAGNKWDEVKVLGKFQKEK